MHTLSSGSARLSLDPHGRLVELTGAGTHWIGRPVPLWELTVQAPSTSSVLGRQRRATPTAPPTVQATETELHLHYGLLSIEDRPADIALALTITAADGEFSFAFDIVNRSTEWTVREIRGPIVAAALGAPTRPALVWPRGAGQRLADPSRAGALQAPYPTRLFMPWMALDAGDSGLYVGCHDDSLQTLTLNADATQAASTLALAVGQLPFAPGETVTRARSLCPYGGTCTKCQSVPARADSYLLVSPPAWAKDASGWQPSS